MRFFNKKNLEMEEIRDIKRKCDKCNQKFNFFDTLRVEKDDLIFFFCQKCCKLYKEKIIRGMFK